MTICVDDLHNWAEAQAQGDSEVEWRNGAARSYYAAFHLAQGAVDICPDNSNHAMGSHERVSERFKLHGTMPARSIAYVLEAMKKVRKIADYELDSEFLKSDGINAVAQYSAFRTKVAAFEAANRPQAATAP